MKGPPWPDFNKVSYPDLPATTADNSTLTSLADGASWVEAELPGGLDASDERPDVYIAIGAASLNGVVFRSQPGANSAASAELLLDF